MRHSGRGPERGIAIGAATLAIGTALVYFARSSAGPLEWGLTVGLLGVAVGAAIAVAREDARSRVALSIVLLVATSVLTGARAADRNLLPLDVWPSQRYAAVLAMASIVGAMGLARRVPWARWLALALGGGGAATGAINLTMWISARGPALWLSTGLWTTLFLTCGAVLIVVLLAGDVMRDAFGRPFSPEEPATLWRAQDPLVSAVKWSVTAQFVAGAMSLLYAWGQPVVPATAKSAVILAIAFLAAATLVLARKVVGVVLLIVTGIGFAAQAAFTLSAARASVDTEGLHVAAFYALFWIAAAVSALVCSVTFVRKLLRARSP